MVRNNRKAALEEKETRKETQVKARQAASHIARRTSYMLVRHGELPQKFPIISVLFFGLEAGILNRGKWVLMAI